jgi:hypothetical protein
MAAREKFSCKRTHGCLSTCLVFHFWSQFLAVATSDSRSSAWKGLLELVSVVISYLVTAVLSSHSDWEKGTC